MAKKKTDAASLLNHVMPATSIVFLTDGQASVSDIAKLNKERVPIFSVAFGRGADFDLLKGISESNNGFVKRVYEDGDASLQLEDFYSLISSPQITDLEFNYQGIEENTLSNRELATFFEGGQFVVTGKIEDGKELSLTITGNKNEGKYSKSLSSCNQNHLRPKSRTTEERCYWKTICSSYIRRACTRGRGCIRTCRKREQERVCYPSCGRRRIGPSMSCKAKHCWRHRRYYWTNQCPSPTVPATRPPSSCLTLKQIPPRSEAQEFMQRLHAFLNIKQLMKKEKLEEAKEIALRSNFVTPLTSLVVVKPCEEEGTSDLEEASARESSSRGPRGQRRRGYSSPVVKSSAKGWVKRGGRHSSRTQKRGRKRKMHKVRQRGRQSYSTKFQKRRKMSENRKATGKNRKGAKPMTKNKKNLRKNTKKVAPSRQKISARMISSKESGNGPKEGSSGGEDLSTLTCSLSLYERNYHRGTKLTTTESKRELGKFSVASAELVGGCCWVLYKDRNWR